MIKKGKLIYISLLLIGIFMASSRLFASDIDIILAELKRLNIKVTGLIEPQEEQLPAYLSGPYWGLLKNVCKEGGYDLATYAGRKVMYVNLPIADNSNKPLNVVVFSCAEKIACVYKVDKETVPGMLPVSNPGKKSK
ncbi:MAG: hypothetical protein ABSE81_00135 [Candidatus Omnitrophota bacterium]|jgi:hypothetical protein